MDELSYNTPTFTKDTEYCQCEYCDGDGWIHSGIRDGEGDFEEINCPKCDGSGQLPIE